MPDEMAVVSLRPPCAGKTEDALALLRAPQWTPPELRIGLPRRRLSIAEYSEAHRWITEGPALPPSARKIRWRNDRFPLQVAIMQAIDDPRWGAVVIVGPPQSGKTDCAVVNPILHRLFERGQSVLYLSPNMLKADDQWRKKIEPAIMADEELAAYVPELRDDIGKRGRRDFTNGASLFLTGAESLANVSSSTIPAVIADDAQAMAPRMGELWGHPIDVARKRGWAYPEGQRTTVIAGTAGTVADYHWQEFLGSAAYRPYVPCLGCGTYQLLLWSRAEYDATDELAAHDGCYLRCANPDCTHHLRDSELPAMLARSAWVSTDGTTDPPETVNLADVPVYPQTAAHVRTCAFWYNALYWPWASWGSFAVDAIRAKDNPDRQRDFAQHVECIPQKEAEIEDDAQAPTDIEAHAAAGQAWGTVPVATGVADGTGTLIVTVDVQAGHIWYEVRAWHKATASSWYIEFGRYGGQTNDEGFESDRQRTAAWRSRVSRTLEQLWAKCTEGWPIVKPDGEEAGRAKPAMILVDCSFLRETVQEFCRLRNGGTWAGIWRPVEGAQSKASSSVPLWPGRPTKEVKGHRFYWQSNTNRAKLLYRDLLAVPPGQPGFVSLPADTPDWLRFELGKQLCSEAWQADKGTWIQVRKSNHLFDTGALQLVGAIALGVQIGTKQAPPPVVVQRRESRPSSGFTTPDGRPYFVMER